MMRFLVSLLAFTYSQELPFLANTGQNQPLLSTDYNNPAFDSQYVPSWLSAPDPLTSSELLDVFPGNPPLQMLNADILAMFTVRCLPSGLGCWLLLL